MRTGGNPIYVKNGVYLYKKHEIKKVKFNKIEPNGSISVHIQVKFQMRGFCISYLNPWSL